MAQEQSPKFVELHFELDIDYQHAFQPEQIITACIAETLGVHENDVHFDGVDEEIDEFECTVSGLHHSSTMGLFRGHIPTTSHEIEALVSKFFNCMQNNALQRGVMRRSAVATKPIIKIRELYETDAADANDDGDDLSSANTGDANDGDDLTSANTRDTSIIHHLQLTIPSNSPSPFQLERESTPSLSHLRTILSSPIIETPVSSPPPPLTAPFSLIGSQLQTYNTLISMGFDTSESVTIATIFGSNVEGAVNCVLGEGVSGMNAIHMHNALNVDIDNSFFGPNPHGYGSLFSMKEDIIEFRRTSVSETLMTGYIRNHDEPLNDDNIPTVIKDIIIRYFNLYFIKLNYNIYNDVTVDEMDEKYVDNDCTMDNMMTHKSDESLDAIPSHCTLPILALKSNQTLREIAIRLEKSYTYSYKDVKNRNQYFSHYQYFIHLWLKFRFLKSIYPIKNSKMDIPMHDINKYKNAYDEDRWVEIPNDFEKVKISDIDMLITRTNPNDRAVLELGIERFDEWTKRWPFRNKPSLSTYEDVMMRSDVFSIKPFSPRPLTQSPSPISAIKPFGHNKRKNTTQPRTIVPQIHVQSDDYNAQKQRKTKYHMDDRMPPVGLIPMPLMQFPVPDDMITHSSGLTSTKFDLFIDISDTDSDDDGTASISKVERHLCNTWTCDSCGGQANDNKNTICAHCFNSRFKSRTLPETPPALRPSLSFDWIKRLKIGDIVDVKDEQDKWYECVIRYVEVDFNDKTLLYIHYIGWKTKWDEKLYADDVYVSRIAKRNTWSKGPFRVESRHSTSPRSAYPNYHFK